MPDLPNLPPPEGDATEGYYPDPLGGKYPRWWDGSQWTTQVGPEEIPPLVPGEDENIPHRGRDPGALVGAAFRLYRRYPTLFLVLAAGVIVPFDLIALATTGAGPYATADLSPGVQVTLAVLGWVLVGPLISALHVHAVATVREGGEPEIGVVARKGLAVLPVVAATTIMSSLGIALGILALIVPGVILFFRWFVAAQVAAIEDDGWLEALRGSRRLTAGNYLHIFIFLIVLAVVLAIPGTILPAIYADSETDALSFLIQLVAHLFTASFTALATALMYYDLVERGKTPDEAGS